MLGWLAKQCRKTTQDAHAVLACHCTLAIPCRRMCRLTHLQHQAAQLGGGRPLLLTLVPPGRAQAAGLSSTIAQGRSQVQMENLAGQSPTASKCTSGGGTSGGSNERAAARCLLTFLLACHGLCLESHGHHGQACRRGGGESFGAGVQQARRTDAALPAGAAVCIHRRRRLCRSKVPLHRRASFFFTPSGPPDSKRPVAPAHPPNPRPKPPRVPPILGVPVRGPPGGPSIAGGAAPSAAIAALSRRQRVLDVPLVSQLRPTSRLTSKVRQRPLTRCTLRMPALLCLPVSSRPSPTFPLIDHRLSMMQSLYTKV